MTGLLIDTSDHRLIRQSTAAIASRYGHDYYAERARARGHIAELWADLGQAGQLGVHLREQYGGGGAGLAELVVVTEELAAHGLPLLIAVISPAICGSILAAHASADMKAGWLPGLADGTRRMAFALTEPDAGSNSHNVSTIARRTPGGWVITGGKYYISAADECEALLLVARDDSAPRGLPAGLRRPQPRTDPGRRAVQRHRPVRDRQGGRVRAAAEGLVRADRRPPGRRAPAGRSPRPRRAGPAGHRGGRRAVRRRAGRRRGGQHRQAGRGRRRAGRAGPVHPDPRRQRPSPGIRPGRPVVRHPADAHRPGQPGDGAELRGQPQPRPAPVVLSPPRTEPPSY
jgi:hypothetical protein